jgi:hypothetical protein
MKPIPETTSRRPGRIEAAILAELRAADGWSRTISNHGPGTGAAIDRMEGRKAHPCENVR